MEQFAANGVAGFQHRTARARRGGRSAGDRRRRQARIADIEFGAKPLCRDLRENRVDAVANFPCAAVCTSLAQIIGMRALVRSRRPHNGLPAMAKRHRHFGHFHRNPVPIADR